MNRSRLALVARPRNRRVTYSLLGAILVLAQVVVPVSLPSAGADAAAPPANVVSLPAAVDVDGNGALDDIVTLVAPEGTALANVRALPVPGGNPAPAGVSLPYGLFEYDVEVANPGDSADVTYVLPDGGVAPTSVHMLQNGVWSDYAQYTSVDPVTGDVTVALRDGGEGDETRNVDGVINDPSGPSTSNQTITVTNSSGASAPNMTFRLERCSQTSGSSCTGATAVGTASGSNNASGDSAALGNGSSWYWGSATALEYDRNYRLSVITSLPASGWNLTGRNCNPNGDDASNSGATAMVVRLDNSFNDRRAACTFTFQQAGGTITARKGGLRNTGTNDTGTFATGLQGATFEYSPNSNFSAPLNDLCVTPAATDASGVCSSGNLANDDYYVREKATPAGWNAIPQIAYGGDAFSQSPLVNYTQQVEIDNSNATTRRFVNRMTNPVLADSCGLNVSLVLDRSGSITPNAATYAAAAKGYVDALANTPSQMKIFSFAAGASADQNTFVSLSTPAGVTSLKSTIDSVYANTGGGTNWDAGLQQAISSGSDLVLFITDGNPTARNGDTGSTNLVNLEDVEYGIASANSVKNAGQTIYAVGVANQGSGAITTENLALVSGPGDYFTADLDTIAETLKGLANQLCGTRIHVRKLVGGQPQAGWTFTAAGGGAGVTFGNNPVVTAGAGGEGLITVNNVPANGTAAAVTVTESLAGKAGYTFDKAACQLNSYPAANTGTASNPQSIGQMQQNQDWYCTFNNVASPTLTLSKTADASPIDAGEAMGFTITASSTGVGTATGVTLSDPLPTGSGVSWSISPAVAGCSITTNTLQCSFGDMATGTSKSVHVTSATAFASCKTYANTATLNATNHAQVQASASVVVRCPALDLIKTADAASVSAGEPIGFTITATNSGAGVAAGLVLSDPLPTGPGISWSIDPPMAGCSITAGTLTCFRGSLSPGASDSVHVTSPTTAASCEVYPNTATLTAINHPQVQASATTTVNCPNLTITKSADASPINAGDAMGFTITVANTGAGVAKSVTLSDPLPTGAGVSWSINPAAAGCSITTNTLNCAFGDMASGASKSVHVTSATTIATPCTTYANTAGAQATNHSQVQASASVNVQCPALEITKTADAATVNAGDAIGFTVTVTNTGAGTAKAATLTDPLPGGNGINWSISPAYAGPGTCGIGGSAPNQTLSCTFGDLASGGSVTVHVTSDTERASCATYNNTAFAAATNATGAQASASTGVACPNLSITKTADASTVSAGSDIGFTITVANPGPGTAKSVTLTDALPGGTGITWTISPATAGCSIAGSAPNQTLNCTFGDMAAGASKTVHVVSPTTGATPCAAYPNTASAEATNNPQVQASATTSVQCPGLQVTKTADNATVNAGEAIGFTITVSNTGAGTATGVTIADPLPTGAGVSWSIDPAKAGCSITINTLNCAFGDMGPGTSNSVHVTSATSFASCKQYPNTATADATNAPAIEASASTTVQCPNVTLTKAADATPVSAGDAIGFTMTATNSGAGIAKGVTLSDPLPTGAGVSWSIVPPVAGCSITTNQLNCDFGDLAPGASASVHVTSPTTPASCKAYPNTATVTATNHPQVEASSSVTVGCPNLAITKTADASPVNTGDPIGFTITVSNSNAAGTGTAKAVTLNDPLPGGNGVDWSIDPAYAGAGTCSITGSAPNQTLNCAFGDMAPGASNSIHIASATTKASAGTYENTATATAENHPPVDDTDDIVVRAPVLTITKTADADAVDAGSAIGFTITVGNSGAGVARSVTLNDPLPGGNGINWSINPAYAGAGTCSIAGTAPDQTLNCAFGDMTSGASNSVHVTSATSFASCEQYANVATAATTNGDNATADDTTTVNCADLNITKTADDQSVSAGSPIGFTITAANAGGGTAKGVTINDPLPTGTGISWSITPAVDGCSITTNTLTCNFGDLGPETSTSVHVTSPTTPESCKAYPNTVSLTATNHPALEASATTTVLCPDLSITKTADAPVVNTGDDIGFTIAVANAGPGVATSVTLNDPLPAGNGIDWSIDPAYAGPGTCSITGSTPTQTLECAFGDLAAQGSVSVHIKSATTKDSAGTYENTATASADNHEPVDDTDTTIVQAPALTIVKTADDESVDAGDDIGFTITVSNSDAEGTGIARSVKIDDPLPAGADADWSIDPAYAGPGTCAIDGAAPTQTLTCALGDMEPGDEASVHIVSATTKDIAEVYDNTATASTTNGESVEDDASIVTVKISPSGSTSSTTTTSTPEGPVTTQAVPPAPGPLPFTGSSTLRLLAVALVLLAAGAALVFGRRRRGQTAQ